MGALNHQAAVLCPPTPDWLAFGEACMNVHVHVSMCVRAPMVMCYTRLI